MKVAAIIIAISICPVLIAVFLCLWLMGFDSLSRVVQFIALAIAIITTLYTIDDMKKNENRIKQKLLILVDGDISKGILLNSSPPSLSA